MLDDMLVIAQMETGSLDPQAELLDVAQFIQHVVEEFQTTHAATHRLLFESSFHKTVMADTRLLRQISANLISNAIKYTPQGSEVTIRVEGSDEQYLLIVKDQGIGISEADQVRLFNAFQRGSNVGNILGTGLGLAIVQQAVDLQGGSIHLESKVGVGTIITVTIPCLAPKN